MNYRWQIQSEPSKDQVQKLMLELNIPETLAMLLVQRGIKDFDSAREFFRPSLNDLHDPFLMKDMERAVDRIEQAIENQERILIYGDYDVDGTTAVSLLFSFLKNRYSQIDTYIPDRYKEGYGVSLAGIDYAEDNEITLIIALDCGIKAIRQVNYALDKGIDFIICDHHRPGNDLPPAAAILDPKQIDCNYPYDELSGCGVGFKLVQALCKRWELPDSAWENLLDLLAISIGADIVPITGENRILCYHGLNLINENPRKGIAYLKDLSGKKDKVLNITDVVFLLGPRINAAGRISHGHLAVDLLTGEDESILEELSTKINVHNNERKELDSSITQSALEMIEQLHEQERLTTVVYDKSWHKGVIGIVASRLIENYYRPTIVFTESNGILAGSARSVKGFDVYNALDNCSDILEQFGGHMYAAGMTLQKARYDEFKNKFEEVVSASIRKEQLIPVIDIDANIDLEEIDARFYRILKQFAPFGPQNMAPVFQTDNLIDSGYSKIVGSDQTHLKIDLVNESRTIRISGIAFGMADKLELVKSKQPLSVAYHIEENEFNGRTTLQMMVKDIKRTADLT